MKRNYQGVLNRIKEISLAHPMVNSADDGRELEFDVKKNNLWPRVFIRTEQSDVVGGQGSVELSVTFSLLVMDRVKADRSNTVDVMGSTHSILTDILATMNKEQLIHLTDNPVITPQYDYSDSQSSGWVVPVKVWLDQGMQCFRVDPYEFLLSNNTDSILINSSDNIKIK